MFPIQCTTFFGAMTAENRRFYEIPHFTNFKFWEAGVGVENFWTKVPKDTPYAKSTALKTLEKR